MIPLINVSDLTHSIKKNLVSDVCAKPTKGIEGFCLYATVNDREMILSTYLSTKPRHFKRSDALLKEAMKIGVKEIRFVDLAKAK